VTSSELEAYSNTYRSVLFHNGTETTGMLVCIRAKDDEREFTLDGQRIDPRSVERVTSAVTRPRIQTGDPISDEARDDIEVGTAVLIPGALSIGWVGVVAELSDDDISVVRTAFDGSPLSGESIQVPYEAALVLRELGTEISVGEKAIFQAANGSAQTYTLDRAPLELMRPGVDAKPQNLWTVRIYSLAYDHVRGREFVMGVSTHVDPTFLHVPAEVADAIEARFMRDLRGG